MQLNMLKGKIHRATVVQAELDYVGSITIDEDLMEASGILEYETHEIVVALNIGTVTIQGSGLELRLMQRDRLRVTGSIERLVFSGGKRGCGD